MCALGICGRTQPALRAIPESRKVAAIFAEAAETRVSQPQVTRTQEFDLDADGIAAE